MKLYEITKPYQMGEFMTDRTLIRKFLRANLDKEFIVIKEIDIDDNGEIDAMGSVVFLKNARTLALKELPVKFGLLYSEFSVEGLNLESFKGFPSFVGEINIVGNKIKSFIGIADQIGETHHLIFNGDMVTEGGLGLLLIKGIKSIDVADNSKWAKIVATHVGDPSNIYACQQELIENGFEEYAIL